MASDLDTAAGAYLVEEALGSDALGIVCRARDEAGGRPVLVRFLSPMKDDPDARRRFQIELPALARIDHPNVVRIEDWGESDGVPYVVYPVVTGTLLSDRLTGGQQLERGQALAILRQVASALDQAHLVGVVHGAVSPATVLLDSDGIPRVIDFGLSLMVNATTTAPEGGVGPAADVYGLAALAQELLSSEATAPLTPLVEDVLRRGLSGDPQRRWPSCTAMVDALDRAVQGRSMAPQLPLPQLRDLLSLNGIRALGQRWRRAPRMPALSAAAIAGVVLLVVVVGRVCQSGPSLELSQTAVHPGDSVVVTGRSLPGGQSGSLQIASRPGAIAQFHTSGSGLFSVKITIPLDLTGPQRIQACWAGACPLAQMLTVLAPQPTPIPAPVVTPPPQATAAPTPAPRATPPHAFTPSISVSPQRTHRGGSITVQGSGFDPGRGYVIALVDSGTSVTLTSGQPGGNGSINADVTIPSNARTGPATVVACISSGSQPTSMCGQQGIRIAF
jgi:serine/threonine-protein kinase